MCNVKIIICLIFFFNSMQPSFYGLQARFGKFFPSSNLVDSLYQGGFEWEVEASARITSLLNLWVNVNFFDRDAHNANATNKTTLRLYPVSFGLKGVIPLTQCFAVYLGAGASTTVMNIKERTAFFKQFINSTTWGGVAKSGLIIVLTPYLFCDAFADYYYSKASVQNNTHNIGGIRVGAGLGVSF